MTVDDVLRDFKGKIRGSIPASIDVTDVEFEGALLVIYTKTPDLFAKGKDLVKKIYLSIIETEVEDGDTWFKYCDLDWTVQDIVQFETFTLKTLIRKGS